MKCTKCGYEIMEGIAFCPYCGGKVEEGKSKENKPIYQTDVKGMRKNGKLVVYRDRTEFVTSSVQKTVYNYSALAAVKKKLGVGTVLGLGLDHINFITEDGSIESCPVNRKDVHEAFLRIQEAINPYLAERKKRLLAQGIRYSLISSIGLTNSGIMDISDDKAVFKGKAGQSKVVFFRDVKFVSASAGSLDFSLTDGTLKSFTIDKEFIDEVYSFVSEAIKPYIAERKDALLAQGIYFSCLSSYGSESGTLNIYEDKAEFMGKMGDNEIVFFQDVRTACLFTESLELFLTNGTSKSFAVEVDIRNEVLAFVKEKIQPYVLKRTVGFDLSFGVDEQIEVNEERGVFHILRQGGSEITNECSLATITKCEQVEYRAPKSALGLLAGAAKAVGVQDKLGAPSADDIISFVGIELTVQTDEGVRTEVIRFGDFSLGMSRSNKKYDQYFAETSKFMEYLGGAYAECELIESILPEPEVETGAVGRRDEIIVDVVSREKGYIVDTVSGKEDIIEAGTVALEKDRLGIAKYIDGISSFISNCPTPMTIAIQGSWGSGKNNIINTLSDSLEGSCSDNRVWFNPRLLLQVNSEDPLPILIGKALIRQLSGAEGSVSKDSAVKVAKGVIELLAGIIAPDSSAGQNLVEGLFKDGSGISPEKLVDAFSKLVEKRAKDSAGKVVIFINELDKLAPVKAVELLMALRIFLDCEGCVFVAAIDYSLFQRGVRENPDMDLDENQEKALFDEIFQMSFRVPVSSQQIRDYVNGKLKYMGIYGSDEEELDFCTALIQHSVGNEPKSIDRLFNSFLLLKNMDDKGLYENKVQRLMLFALLCMQTRFYAVYDGLKRMKNQVTPEILSELSSEESKITAYAGLSGEEKEEFCTFAHVLCDIIDTDNTVGISQSEGDVFIKVLEYSSITSK
ncbi:P-loop NTPase fold protein [Parablautia muri]|uniref:Zinc-ribbon domain-containing protein n=1 Tax=Parablautia muri TaxID=2320879 RepID=A0A9X5GRG0_9FIRM|nr:P-loop NTPase fold protein [Parablautia muri]NBJ91062.1 zinc-ribbon domain-containing protein [Parablautia muri]